MLKTPDPDPRKESVYELGGNLSQSVWQVAHKNKREFVRHKKCPTLPLFETLPQIELSQGRKLLSRLRQFWRTRSRHRRGLKLGSP